MIVAPLILIFIIIAIALVFDFTNGFHDSANSISTVVSTKVLSPRNAVAFAAFFNFVAAFGFGVAVHRGAQAPESARLPGGSPW